MDIHFSHLAYGKDTMYLRSLEFIKPKDTPKLTWLVSSVTQNLALFQPLQPGILVLDAPVLSRAGSGGPSAAGGVRL